MVYDKTIAYTYTDSELKSIDKKGFDYLIPIILLFIPIILIIFIINDKQFLDVALFIFVLAIISIFIVLSIIAFVVTAKNAPKDHANYRAKQIVYFTNNMLCYENGSQLYSIDKKYISKIKQTKNFYRIDIELRGYTDIGKFPICPYIPRRVALRMDMVQLAAELNIDYKDSLFWKS